MHMEYTRGTRAMTAASGMAAAVGLTAVLYGTLHDNTAHAVGGTCLTLTALTVIALILIRRWIIDASAERRALADATRKAEDERSRYLAAKAALECEQGRRDRDMAAERRGIAMTVSLERQKLQTEFEENRAALITETMEATVRMIHNRKLGPDAPRGATLILFPHQHAHQEPQPERTRSREHGVVGP